MTDKFYLKEQKQRTYARTLLLLLFKSFYEIAGEENVERLMAEFSISGHIYIRADVKTGLDKKLLAAVWGRMHDYIKNDVPIDKLTLKVREAYDSAVRKGNLAEASFLHYRRVSRINYTGLDGYNAYFAGSLFKRTGELSAFDLMPYDKGFFLLLPDMDDVTVIEHPEIPEKLFEAYNESYKTAHLLGLENISMINNEVCSDKSADLVLTCESIFENKLALTAREIISKSRKFVFLAGPSSSGKTSTANRLAFALKSYAVKPHIISLDDYYKDRTNMLKIGEKIDFESIDALDLELFASDMQKLLDGGEAEIPEFDFITSKRLYKGKKITLGEKDILIIEGIHSLNGKFSESLPAELCYKVYVSALSQLNIDPRNRIHSTDLRLLRRITRDHRTRGYNAANTLAVWPGVRRGEEKNIFPFQNNADAVINSTMIYELAAIKPYAEKVLFSVAMDDPSYLKARELLKCLDFAVPIPDGQIPSDSIIREFIGGSVLNVR